MDSQTLVQALRATGYVPRAYSGRGMRGLECVGVALRSAAHLWRLGQSLGAAECEVPEPNTDHLGSATPMT